MKRQKQIHKWINDWPTWDARWPEKMSYALAFLVFWGYCELGCYVGRIELAIGLVVIVAILVKMFIRKGPGLI